MKIIRKKIEKKRCYTNALSQRIKKANSTKPSKKISLAAQLLTSVAASARHYDDDMIGVAFYEECRPYKNFKFEAQIGGLFCKTLEGCYRNKNPDSHSAGVRAIRKKQLAQQEPRKLSRKF